MTEEVKNANFYCQFCAKHFFSSDGRAKHMHTHTEACQLKFFGSEGKDWSGTHENIIPDITEFIGHIPEELERW